MSAADPLAPPGVLVALRGVEVARAGRTVLRGIDFDVRGGERVVLLGANGAGKSTVLRVLAGLLHADAGRASVGGHDLARASLAARGCVGYVHEVSTTRAEVTVREHVTTAAALGGVSLERTQARALLRKHGLEQLADAPSGALSHGQSRRVALAAALAAEPEVLLLDEPFEGLDTTHADALVGMLRDASTSTRALIIASQPHPALGSLVTRAVCLARGRIVADGPPAALRAQHSPVLCVRLWVRDDAIDETHRSALGAARAVPHGAGHAWLVDATRDGVALLVARAVASGVAVERVELVPDDLSALSMLEVVASEVAA